jgi:hypothetical protein
MNSKLVFNLWANIIPLLPKYMWKHALFASVWLSFEQINPGPLRKQVNDILEPQRNGGIQLIQYPAVISTSTPITSILDPHDINHYFQSINTDANFSAPIQVQIPEGNHIPVIREHIVQKFLLNLKRTSSGPDELPFWLWRDFAYDLAPIITSVFNSSLKYQTVPLLWKMANILPIPKETPLDQSNQLRPISVTNVIMRLFEKIVYQSELHHLNVEFIGNDQYAYKKGLNSTMALLKCQHKWLQWQDSDAYCVWVFSSTSARCLIWSLTTSFATNLNSLISIHTSIIG